MELLHWIGGRWFEVAQTLGIIAGLFFNALVIRKEDQARRIANLISIKQDHRDLWKEVYARPELSRMLEKDVNLAQTSVSPEERLFVKMLILHLDSVHRTMEAGMFIKLEGLQHDVREFFSSPITKMVWAEMKPFQDEEFVAFVENCFAV